MAYTFEDPAERERRRWTKENAYLWVRPDAHRFMRPDAERFLRPGHKLDRYWERPEYQSPAMRAYAKPPAAGRVAGYAQDQSFAGAPAPAAKSGPSHCELLKLKSDIAALQARQDAIRASVKAWKDELAQKRTRDRAEAARLKRRADAAWDRFIAAFDRHWDACGKAGFDADQPRVPAGNPDGGQWTSEGGSGASGESGTEGVPGRARWVRLADAGSLSNPGVLSDAGFDKIPKIEEAEVVPAAGRGGIAKEFLKLSVREFVSRFCKASINRELPSQFEDMTIADVLEIAKGGDSAAKKCYKLLNQPRFRK